ncbi:MAG TPA: ornithine--oxo-acid transaminase [Patescibacteria group bacterium]|nr:ornithine--oxo-acid transaminase [Patescibacteria group bacterium]
MSEKNAQYYIDLENTYTAHGYHPIPVVINRAEGVWLWDVEGKKYLDCLSAYSAVNQGHRHPRIMKAMYEQAEKLTLTSRAFHNDQLGAFMKKLSELAGMEMALPMNTGAEAVESAIKVARKWGYEKKGVGKNKAQIIACCENFHGRTTTIVGFSTDPDANTGFGPFCSGFTCIPYDDTAALEKAITKNTVAFLVEPIQGEAGVKVPREGYLRAVREICTKHGILLILDEIQTGFCRTGKMFAWMHEGAKPDILTVGKALSGGVYPVSAAISSGEIMSVITPGTHGSTYGGNPLACAIGTAALDVLVDEKLDERAQALGERFRKGLRGIATDKVIDVRGKGLLNAIELKKNAGTARESCERLMELGVLAKDTHGQTIRFAPPLVITEEEIDWLLERIAQVL